MNPMPSELERGQDRPNDVTLTVAKLAALFSSLVAALYASTQTEPAPIVSLFLTSGPLLAVVLWLRRDARRTGVGAVQDLGYFLLLAWPVVIPRFAFRTRGRSGWQLMLGLFALVGASSISGVIVDYALWYFGAGT